jgi:tRNA A37 threonylcarbamoyladenosine biosynthesis protein TsaE
VYLITGACGVGKTWLMKELIKQFNATKEKKAGKYCWLENEESGICIIGKYTGDVFDGSDRLSMSIMTDNKFAKQEFENKIVLAEGDRFTNNVFIGAFDPIIIRINGNGNAGRKLRNTAQTERHVKSIATRVDNLPYHYMFTDSKSALNGIVLDMENPKFNNQEYRYSNGRTTIF